MAADRRQKLPANPSGDNMRNDKRATPVRKELAGAWQLETAGVFLRADSAFRGPTKDGMQPLRVRYTIRNKPYS